MKQNIAGLSLKDLENILQGWGQPAFRAKQIFSWVYQKLAVNFDAFTDIPENLRKDLKANFSLYELNLAKKAKSIDGTEKFLFELSDAKFVEAVIIPAENRSTGCISTQVGCKFACNFCASGKLGFTRNLTAAEIVQEVLYLKKESAGRLTHIVFMGTGEPLDNYNNVLSAIRIINSKEGLNIGARRITISTCGLIPEIKQLSKEGLQIELSVSLHSADDKIRSGLMPVNKKYPLKDLIAACRNYAKETNRQVTFEYVLIKGLIQICPMHKRCVQ